MKDWNWHIIDTVLLLYVNLLSTCYKEWSELLNAVLWLSLMMSLNICKLETVNIEERLMLFSFSIC